MARKKEISLFDSVKSRSNNIVNYHNRNIIKGFINYNEFDMDLYYLSPFLNERRNRIMFNFINKSLKKMNKIILYGKI